jgi:integrase
MLAEPLRDLLAAYWRWKRPTEWLFPGRMPDRPIGTSSVFRACQKAAMEAGITKPIHPHSLRQAWAYYTTFQSSLILKAIGFGRAEFAEVYGHHAGRLAPLAVLEAASGPSCR